MGMPFRFHIFAGIVLWIAATVPGVSAQTAEFRRGVELQRKGDLEGARGAYEEVLRSNPRSVEALSNLGMVYLQLGRPQDASRVFNDALALRSDLTAVRYYLGLAHYREGDFRRAAVELSQVVEAQPRDARTLHLLGLARLGEGRTAEAAENLAAVMALDPRNLMAAQTLATTLLALDRVEETRKVLDGPLSKIQTPEADMIRGMYQYASGDFRKALEFLRRAAAQNPDLPTLRYHLGRAYLASGDLDAAQVELARGLAADPEGFNVNAYYGWVLTKLQRPEEALQPLNKALKQRPDDSALHWTLGTAFGALRRNEEAISALERAVALEPDLTPAHVLLGQMYARQRRAADAERQRKIVSGLEAKDQAAQSERGKSEAPPEFGKAPKSK
jgi:protein O-GlcNAc transferase